MFVCFVEYVSIFFLGGEAHFCNGFVDVLTFFGG